MTRAGAAVAAGIVAGLAVVAALFVRDEIAGLALAGAGTAAVVPLLSQPRQGRCPGRASR